MHELPEEAELFGRAPDLAALRELVECGGKRLMLLSGQPRSGKSWLTKQLCDSLSDKDWLVGYYESTGGEHDTLLPAIAKAYLAWFSKSTLRERAWSQMYNHAGRFGSDIVKAVGTLVELAATAVPQLTIVTKTIRGLYSFQESVREASRIHPSIPYDVARRLVDLLCFASGRPLFIALDAWEQGTNVQADFGTLRKFMGNLQEWRPHFHVLVVTRNKATQSNAYEFATQLATYNAAGSEFALPPLHLEDPKEAQRLVEDLRKTVPGARVVPDAWLIERIGGHPAIIEDWKYLKPDSEAEMERLASDAQAQRYPEVRAILEKLFYDNCASFDVALRLAIMPEFTSDLMWEPLRDIVLGESAPDVLVELQSRDLLRDMPPPTFGHTTRFEAVRQCLASNGILLPYARLEQERMLKQLASRIGAMDESDLPFGRALTTSLAMSDWLRVDPKLRWLAIAANSLFGSRDQIDEEFHQLTALVGRELPDASPLVGVVLSNELVYAKEEDDLSRRDTLLDELRNLVSRYPDDAAVRERLAKGLVNTLNHAKEEDDLSRRDNLLDELRNLVSRYPDAAAVRELLAGGLFNTLVYAKEEDDLSRCDTLLDELRNLVSRYPDDP